MIRGALLIALMLAGTAWGNTYYVARTDATPAGDDARTAAQAQSASTPWLTIQHALDTAFANGADVPPIIIYVKAGAYAEGTVLQPGTSGKTCRVEGYTTVADGSESTPCVTITSSSTSFNLLMNNTIATGSYTFKNITFGSDAPTSGKCQVDYRAGANLSLTNCVFGGSNNPVGIQFASSDNVGTLTLTGCTFSSTNTAIGAAGTATIAGIVLAGTTTFSGSAGIFLTGNTTAALTVSGTVGGTCAAPIRVSTGVTVTALNLNAATFTSGVTNGAVYINNTGVVTALTATNVTAKRLVGYIAGTLGTLTVTGGAFTPDAQSAIRLEGTTATSVVVSGGTYTLSGTAEAGIKQASAAAAATTNIVVKDATFSTGVATSSAINLAGAVAHSWVSGNTVTITNAAANPSYAIAVGSETYTAAATLGPAYLIGNTVHYTGTYGGHGLFCGTGSDNSAIIGNTVYVDSTVVNNLGGAIGVVCKSNGVTVANNKICGGRGILLKGAQGCRVLNNTVRATYSAACVWYVQDSGGSCDAPRREPSNNLIMNNIFQAVGTDVLVLTDLNPGCPATGDDSIVLDYNLYHTDQAAFSNIRTAALTTANAHVGPSMSPLATAWATYSPFASWCGSDSHSVYGDPKFISTTYGSPNLLALSSSSPAMRAGYPANATMGAWIPKSSTSGHNIIGGGIMGR